MVFPADDEVLDRWRSDYIPECDLLNPAQNGECGPSANQNLGRLVTPTSTSIRICWKARACIPGNWQFGISVQQEVFPRVSVEAGYHRRNFDSFINPDPVTATSTLTTTFTVADNRAVTPADYNPYSVPVPAHHQRHRPCGSGGYVVEDLFDISPTAFGRTDILKSGKTHPYGFAWEIRQESGQTVHGHDGSFRVSKRS